MNLMLIGVATRKIGRAVRLAVLPSQSSVAAAVQLGNDEQIEWGDVAGEPFLQSLL